MTDRDSTNMSIGEVVGSITSRLDVTAILHDYIRHLSLIVDQQESLARDAAVSVLGETGEALYRSVRDAHRLQAQRGVLPSMESVLDVPGLLELATPPWEHLLKALHDTRPEAGPAPAEAAAGVSAPVLPVASPVGPTVAAEEAVAPSVEIAAEPPRVPSATRAARPGAVAPSVSARPCLYGIEIDPVNLEAAKKIVEEAREAVLLGEPRAYFAYDKRVGRHKWRKELYQVVFRDEAHAVGLALDGEATVEGHAHAPVPDAPFGEGHSMVPDGDIPDDDIVFGDDEGLDDPPMPETPHSPASVDAGVPAFLSDAGDAPSPPQSTDAFGRAVDGPVDSWLRPFGSRDDDPVPEETAQPENRVVAFAPTRAPLRPAKVAPGLARPGS